MYSKARMHILGMTFYLFIFQMLCNFASEDFAQGVGIYNNQ